MTKYYQGVPVEVTDEDLERGFVMIDDPDVQFFIVEGERPPIPEKIKILIEDLSDEL